MQKAITIGLNGQLVELRIVKPFSSTFTCLLPLSLLPNSFVIFWSFVIWQGVTKRIFYKTMGYKTFFRDTLYFITITQT